MTDTIMPVISHWGNGWHGLDALTNIWNVILGLAVFFLARVLGALYFINNIDDKELTDKCRRAVLNNTGLFLLFFLAFVIRTLVSDGFAVNPDTQEVYMQPFKYFTNFIEMPVVLILFLIGVVLVLFGIGKTVLKKTFDKGSNICSVYIHDNSTTNSKNYCKNVCHSLDRKSTRLNSSHVALSRMPSSA